MKFTTEMLEKAKSAKSAEELLELAKAENIELTAEEAAKYFADLHKSGELSDEELENAAGGGCYTLSQSGQASSPEAVHFLYWVGKYVEVVVAKNFRPDASESDIGCTSAADITDRKVEFFEGYYYPKYKVRFRSDQSEKWIWQNKIQD